MASFVLQKFGRPDSNALVFQPREDNLINFFGNLEYLLKNLDRPILVLDIDLKITGFGGAIQGILPVIDADIG